MIKWATAALGLVVSMAVGAGLAGAHDKAEKPSVTGESIDLLHDPDVGSRAEGDDAELEGTLEILHEDRKDGSGVYRHFLSTHEGKRLSLEGVQHPDLLTGDLVRVRGVRSGQKLQLQTKTAAALEVLQFAPLSNTFGPQKTAVFLVNFADKPSYQPFTTSVMKTYVDDLISPFFPANSYGQASLVVDVFGWYTMPFINSGCPTSSIQLYASQAAVAAGINLSEYTRRVYFFPLASCPWSGSGTVGGNPSHSWLNGSTGDVFIHELGHNLGLYHSHSMSCAPEILGPNCTTYEYGDVTDIMGASSGHFNPFQKRRLGWLDFGVSPPITMVQQSGTYTIDAYDVPGTGPKALMIPRGATAQSFYVRRSSFGPPYDGVYVYFAQGPPNNTYTLDMTPETPDHRSDGNLRVGMSFTDPVSGITITTVSVSSTSATIAVTMGGVPPSLPSTPTALAGGPQLTWTPGTPTTQASFVVERAAGPTAAFAPIATTTAPNYLDTNGVAGQCYRVRATNAGGTSGPSNVACATTPPPPPPPGGVTLTITTNSPIGREMTFSGTLTGSTSLSATTDSIAIAAKYIVVDKTRKTWTVKATGLLKGPHTFTVASGTLAVSKSFTVLK